MPLVAAVSGRLAGAVLRILVEWPPCYSSTLSAQMVGTTEAIVEKETSLMPSEAAVV
jgi:hypothetical protein